jgi:hypothetical protein
MINSAYTVKEVGRSGLLRARVASQGGVQQVVQHRLAGLPEGNMAGLSQNVGGGLAAAEDSRTPLHRTRGLGITSAMEIDGALNRGPAAVGQSSRPLISSSKQVSRGMPRRGCSSQPSLQAPQPLVSPVGWAFPGAALPGGQSATAPAPPSLPKPGSATLGGAHAPLKPRAQAGCTVTTPHARPPRARTPDAPFKGSFPMQEAVLSRGKHLYPLVCVS